MADDTIIITGDGWQDEPEHRGIGNNDTETLYPKLIRGRVALVRRDGTIVVPPIYKYLYRYYKGVAEVELEDDSFGYIDKYGREISEQEFYKARYPEGGTEDIHGESAVISPDGTITIPGYDMILDFSDGLAMVGNDGDFGVIDVHANVVLPLEYSDMRIPSGGYICAAKDDSPYGDKWGVLDRENRIVIPFEYDSLDQYGCGLIPALKDDKWGYIDITGRCVIPFQYEEAGVFYHDVAGVKIDGQWGMIDKRGNYVVEPEYDEITVLDDGFVSFKKDDKYGVMDSTGNILIDAEYDEEIIFYEGIAQICRYDKYGYINTKGEIIAPCEYEEGGFFINGLAQVKSNRGYTYIDTTGREIIPPVEEYLPYEFPDEYITIDLQEGIFADRNGNIIKV